MDVITNKIEFSTQGHNDIIDLTPQIGQLLSNSGLQEGSVLVSAVGSTTGISTLEFEPGLVNHDVAEMFERLAPYDNDYKHNATWGDDNGSAHLRSLLTGTSKTFPFQ